MQHRKVLIGNVKMKDFKQTMTEAQGWPMDKLVDYIMDNYHEGCVMRVNSMRREAEMLKNQETPKYNARVKNQMVPLYEGKKIAKKSTVEVDGITGATFTSDAVKENVKRGLEYYWKHKK